MTDYIAKHRELRHRMQVAGFPNIEAERTTVRYMVQGLAAQPEMHNLAIMMSCQQPNSIKEFNNHMQQAQLIQAQATAAQAAAPYKTTRKTYNRPACRHPRPTKPQAHHDKPKSHKGLWCTIHGSLTHNTETCYARRH